MKKKVFSTKSYHLFAFKSRFKLGFWFFLWIIEYYVYVFYKNFKIWKSSFNGKKSHIKLKKCLQQNNVRFQYYNEIRKFCRNRPTFGWYIYQIHDFNIMFKIRKLYTKKKMCSNFFFFCIRKICTKYKKCHAQNCFIS